MIKNDNWLNALFALVFIAAPILVLYFFFLPSWNDHQRVEYGYLWLIAIGYFTYSILISWLWIKIGTVSLRSLAFNIPITLAFGLLLVTDSVLPYWAMFMVILFVIIFSLPVNIFITKLENRQIKHKKNNHNK